jgi:hypothetical protein
VAFAQRPGKASISLTMKGPTGTTAHMLIQGIAWVDQEGFNIVRMRTDLLTRHPEIGLDQQTTKVNFREEGFADLAAPLWLPRDVDVYVKFGEAGDRHVEKPFWNAHHYMNYRRYRVSAKIVAP